VCHRLIIEDFEDEGFKMIEKRFIENWTGEMIKKVAVKYMKEVRIFVQHLEETFPP